MPRLNVGDWVRFYHSGRGRMRKGYIIRIDGNHADIRGLDKRSYLNQRIINLIPCEEEYTLAAILTLINIALDTKDRNWFEKLTSELKRIQEVEG
ncbi:IDEAL domain-containing protein [Bacillus swezeyi]|uniref:IDEAL domain-containing protein n=1 Tax=Bacillus swezeyi TaxID=1925020 RepID=A0A5M8RQY2_9BACI|nr:IDEAL domain-containing protein [Bacillus swezeyi]KAA6450987.1 IDEAL domain-containing protein [Bacillus swezeyi]